MDDKIRITLSVVDTDTGEVYGEIEDVEQYNLNKSMAAADLATEIRMIIEQAQTA